MFGGEWVGAVVSVIVSVVMLLCVFFTGRPERCDHMRPHATTRYLLVFCGRILETTRQRRLTTLERKDYV